MGMNTTLSQFTFLIGLHTCTRYCMHNRFSCADFYEIAGKGKVQEGGGGRFRHEMVPRLYDPFVSGIQHEIFNTTA